MTRPVPAIVILGNGSLATARRIQQVYPDALIHGEEAPAVLVHCRVSDPDERVRLRNEIRDKVRAITGMNCVVELVPPRTLPRTSSGKLSRAKARNLYLSGEIQPFDLAA